VFNSSSVLAGFAAAFYIAIGILESLYLETDQKSISLSRGGQTLLFTILLGLKLYTDQMNFTWIHIVHLSEVLWSPTLARV